MPFKQSVHISKDLEKISLKYRNDAYIGDMVAPKVPVKHMTDQYYMYGKENFILPETRRAHNAPSNEADYMVTTGAYECVKHSIKKFVSDDEVANSDPGLKPLVDATEFATDIILLRKEYEIMKVFDTGASWSGESSIGAAAKWTTNTTTTSPLPYFFTAVSTVIAAAAKHPNLAVIAFPVWQALKDHVSVVERVKYTSDVLTEKVFASLFDIPKVVVGKAIYNTAVRGVTEVPGHVWADNCLVMYNEPNPGIRKTSAGYNFVQQGYDMRVKKWYDSELEGTWVAVSCSFAPKVISADCGYTA